MLLVFFLTKNKALNNPKYVNPFRKVSKDVVHKLDDNVNSFIGSVSDSVSFINNSRKMEFVSLKPIGIQSLTSGYFNGFNEGFDTDILLEKSNVNIGENYFDALASIANYALAKAYRVVRPTNDLPRMILFSTKALSMVLARP